MFAIIWITYKKTRNKRSMKKRLLFFSYFFWVAWHPYFENFCTRNNRHRQKKVNKFINFYNMFYMFLFFSLSDFCFLFVLFFKVYCSKDLRHKHSLTYTYNTKQKLRQPSTAALQKQVFCKQLFYNKVAVKHTGKC